MDAHGVEGVDEGVVFSFSSAVGQDGVGAAPDGEPGQVEEGKCVRAMHGGDEADLPKIGVEAGDVKHFRQVGAKLERVKGDDAVEGERAGREGVAGAAGQVGILFAGHTRAGNLADGGNVGGREGREREGAKEGVDASGARLAVGEGEFRARVERGRGGRIRGRGQR